MKAKERWSYENIEPGSFNYLVAGAVATAYPRVGKMSLLIRASHDADVDTLAAIYADSVRTGTASWEYEPPTVAEFAERRREILANNFPYLVAEQQDTPVGYAYASSFRSRIGYRFTVEDSVYVAAGAHRQGIGKALLLALIAACRSRGLQAMIAVIGDSEHTASIRLHESCGFEMIGVFPKIGFKFDRWLDSVQMYRALSDKN